MTVASRTTSAPPRPAAAMPFVSESVSRVKWPSNESIHAGSSSSCSPASTSPDSTMRRRSIRRSCSQEPFVIRSDARDSRSQSPASSLHDDDFLARLSKLIGWYPCFLLRIARTLLAGTWTQLLFTLPTLWLWCLTRLLQLPLTVLRLVLLWPRGAAKKRTVLISGGSTIQALHLARNFRSAGARVVVCEVEGLFALAKYSTAVSRFYTLPRPAGDHHRRYVRALCDIVDREHAVHYVPVAATTPAYYDAVAKPHLELLGCSCFCPGLKQVWLLDDTLEVLKRCQKLQMPTPAFHAVTSPEDVRRLYDTGAVVRGGPALMSTAGLRGLRDRCEVQLPPSRSDLRLPAEVSEHQPWVVVQHGSDGEHFLTCTTVRESRVVANVTCRSSDLVAVRHRPIDAWLDAFFAGLALLRPVSGHVSFRFAVVGEEVVVPLGCRVGVSLPYVGYTSEQPRLVWKACRHSPPVEAVTRPAGSALDRREAVFAVWDPLPYCAYYLLRLPFRNLLGFVRRQRFPRPATVSVR